MASTALQAIAEHNKEIISKWNSTDQPSEIVKKFMARTRINSTFKVLSTYSMCQFLMDNDCCDSCFSNIALRNPKEVLLHPEMIFSLHRLLATHTCLELDLHDMTIWHDDVWYMTIQGVYDNVGEKLYKFQNLHEVDISLNDGVKRISLLIYAAAYFTTTFPIAKYYESLMKKRNVLSFPYKLIHWQDNSDEQWDTEKGDEWDSDDGLQYLENVCRESKD